MVTYDCYDISIAHLVDRDVMYKSRNDCSRTLRLSEVDLLWQELAYMDV